MMVMARMHAQNSSSLMRIVVIDSWIDVMQGPLALITITRQPHEPLNKAY